MEEKKDTNLKGLKLNQTSEYEIMEFIDLESPREEKNLFCLGGIQKNSPQKKLKNSTNQTKNNFSINMEDYTLETSTNCGYFINSISTHQKSNSNITTQHNFLEKNFTEFVDLSSDNIGDENKNIIINNYNIFQNNNFYEMNHLASSPNKEEVNSGISLTCQDLNRIIENKPKSFFKKRERSNVITNVCENQIIDLENNQMEPYENNNVKNQINKFEIKNLVIDMSKSNNQIIETNFENEIKQIQIEWCNSIDNEQLPDWTFIENNFVTNPKIMKFLNFDMKQIYCSCTDKCNNITNCPCARFNYMFNNKISFNYEIKKYSKPKKSKKNNSFLPESIKRISSNIKDFEIFECGRNCSCGKNSCLLSLLNSISEPSHWIMNNKFYIKRIKKSSLFNGEFITVNMWGLFTKIDIPKNCFILEYVGQVITNREADKRGEIADNLGISYLFDMSEPNNEIIEKYLKASGRSEEKNLLNYCLEEEDFPLVIDATDHGNLSRFINHSCDPNLKTQLIHLDYIDPRYTKIAFFSKKDIKANCELTFDYCYEGSYFGREMPCLCQSKKCRKLLIKKKEKV